MESKTPILYGPDHFKIYYHTNEEGNVWLDAKNSPIILTQPLVGHIDSKNPYDYMERCLQSLNNHHHIQTQLVQFSKPLKGLILQWNHLSRKPRHNK